jgi:hypothetical protein
MVSLVFSVAVELLPFACGILAIIWQMGDECTRSSGNDLCMIAAVWVSAKS